MTEQDNYKIECFPCGEKFVVHCAECAPTIGDKVTCPRCQAEMGYAACVKCGDVEEQTAMVARGEGFACLFCAAAQYAFTVAEMDKAYPGWRDVTPAQEANTIARLVGK